MRFLHVSVRCHCFPVSIIYLDPHLSATLDPECQLPTDVALQSSDDVVFGAHIQNLELFSTGFPVAEHTITPVKEIIHLSETSAVLSLLLRFMHRKPQPDCSNVDFAVIAGLAEAVEKYGVHSAMELCAMLMR